MRYTVRIVWDIFVQPTVLFMIFVKVLFFPFLDIIELDFDLFVPVNSSMFVSKTKQVNKFVQNNAIIMETFVGQY